MRWFPLAMLRLLLLIFVSCRLCAARNDPGGRRLAGVHLPPWKLSLPVALPVAAVALLAALLIVLACRLRNRDAAAVAAAPAAQNRDKVVGAYKLGMQSQYWRSTHLWSSESPRNPMSINPTMVRSAQTTPSPNYYQFAAFFSASPPTPTPTVSSAAPAPTKPAAPSSSPKLGSSRWWLSSGSSPTRFPEKSPPTTAPPGPGPAASSATSADDRASTSRRGCRQSASPLRSSVPPARLQADRKQLAVIKDPLACYSPALSVLLTELHYDLLESATNGFKRKSLPGGRVGPWNVVLKDTQFVEDEGLPAQVIIKRHHTTFTEEDCKRIREELKCKCTLRHKNLVKLHGYTLGKGRLFLVYDYMPNGSLENRLFPVNGVTDLDWLARYRIAKEVAQGLDPLHVSSTPHGSISVSSIMLDRDYNARLDDHFYYRPDKSSSSRAVATAEKSEASLEADIADLGAVFLELVCGRRRTDTNFSENGTTTTLVDWVWALYGEAYKEPEDLSDDLQLQRRVNEDRLFGAVDRTLDGEIVKAEASKLLILGLACSHPDSKQRPKIRDVRNVLLDKDPVPELPLSKPQL